MRRFATVLGLLVIVAACATSTVAPPSASSRSSLSAAPSGSSAPATISTAEAAAALVIASDKRFEGIGPEDPNLIGACCFWEANEAAGGYRVRIEIGWGDCPAGCINRHVWIYSVTTDAKVALVSEDGPAVPPGVGTGGGAGDGTALVGIRGVATGGPVCPVVRPNDPNCADRPVRGAVVHVFDGAGTEVAQLETDAAGAFVVTLPPGRYRVEADPVEGLMRAPAPIDVEVDGALATVQLQYDTGIR